MGRNVFGQEPWQLDIVESVLQRWAVARVELILSSSWFPLLQDAVSCGYFTEEMAQFEDSE
jgi:hypothetical protein